MENTAAVGVWNGLLYDFFVIIFKMWDNVNIKIAI